MEKTNKKIFIKNGDCIVPKPDGIDYELIPGKVYNFSETRTSDGPFLSESQSFTLPEIYYLSEDDNKFINKTIKAFNQTNKMTTGVLLSGIKGSGKTLMAKKIAMQSGLPIIVIDPCVNTMDIEPFFAKTDTDCCIIFDEVDKYWSTRGLLTFLDGVKPTCKKLVICTCNKEKDIDEYLNDRCSRIRYKKMFSCLDKDAAQTVINDIIKNNELAKKARDFIFENAKVLSYDNVTIFAEEIRNNPNESLESILNDLNLGGDKKKQILEDNAKRLSIADVEKTLEEIGDKCCEG